MLILHYFSFVDHSLGKFDVTALSQQMLMEMLVSGLSDTKKYRAADDEFIDVCHWRGVKCNEDGDAISMMLSGHGTVNLSCMARTLQRFQTTFSQLKGSLETKFLPDGLVKLVVHDNQLCGSVDFAALPVAMQECVLTKNAFSGSADFTQLPPVLTRLEIQRNAFSGEVDFSSLPETLARFLLGKNFFSGSLRITRLPKALTLLSLDENKFVGTAVINPAPGASITLTKTGVVAIVDGSGHPVMHPGVVHETMNCRFDTYSRKDLNY